MAKSTKTNAMRLLDKACVAYSALTYQVDENDLAATHVAEQLGEDINQVFKTLVLRGERTGLFVCVIPGNKEVDLRKAARAAGDKKAEMIAMKELLGATGYIRGGCSPIGMKKPLPTFFDSSALRHDFIFVSAGVRGIQLRMHPQELIDFTGATTTSLVKDNDDE